MMKQLNLMMMVMKMSTLRTLQIYHHVERGNHDGFIFFMSWLAVSVSLSTVWPRVQLESRLARACSRFNPLFLFPNLFSCTAHHS